jgi:putative Holliday junction resolvase
MEPLLGVDYGRKRCGLAVTDALWITAQPLMAVEGSATEAIDAIVRVCDERSIARIVVGLPLNMDGSEGEMAREVRAFAKQVGERTGHAVVLFDERLTSFSAEEALKGRTPTQRKKQKGRVDAMAAAQILFDYMERERRR